MAKVTSHAVATPARQSAFSIAYVTSCLGSGARVGGVRRRRGGVSLTAVVGIMWTIRLDVLKHIGMQILRLGLQLFIGLGRRAAVKCTMKHGSLGYVSLDFVGSLACALLWQAVVVDVGTRSGTSHDEVGVRRIGT